MARKGILIVDDDRDLCGVIADQLRSEGFHVMCAYDGRAGLNLLYGGYIPNLILLDVAMPGMSGIQFLDELKHTRNLQDIPVVVVSAGKVQRSFGWVVKLRKPFSTHELLSLIRDYQR